MQGAREKSAMAGARACSLLLSPTFEVIFVREPSPLPVFGKLGAKASVAVVASPVASAGIAARLRDLLATHGGMALKLSVIAWTILVLGTVFFMLQG
ncbi:hypothetical protein CK231_19360 [Mesorhizobium loti]|uniref:Uncharacterized protein n=4 Tax=Mesorhizobium TaxID=68287 RepID=A0A3M9XGA1_9HYPH|nr:hypothetical protein [Mesorhizobium japonicum]PBB12576.1 hypothetical protein CK231_19360 [Mesorhizobium loti]QGX77674.1 hypothetical protein EB234_12760 [Mesorhizobium japonicum R7A]RXT33934.1 hypothetical protein B5V01_33255 [Mesorhizobium erdmanii]MUT29887.1 hypothetical protein [Mesorhizobium japonicum]